MGYFAGIRAALYRETLDGRKVYGRRSILPWRRQWYYVTPVQESELEKRVIRVHVGSLSLMIALIAIIGSDRILTDPKWLPVLLIVVLIPALQSWTISGLEPATIDEGTLKGLDRRVLDINVARAFGAPMLWFLLAASVLMMIGQVYVIMTVGAWWAWAGATMFMVTTITTVRQILLLRSANRE